MPALCEQWHCIYCGNKFPTKIALKIHFSEHREKMEYCVDKCCCSCGKIFSEFHYFENHLLQTGHMNDNPNLILMQSPTNLVSVTHSNKSNNSIMNINSAYCQPSSSSSSSAITQVPNMILNPKDRSSSFHSINGYNNSSSINNNNNNIAFNNSNGYNHMKPLYEGPTLSLPRNQYSQQSLTSLVDNNNNTNRTNNSFSSYGSTTAAINNTHHIDSNYSFSKSNVSTSKEYGILYFCGESSSVHPSTGTSSFDYLTTILLNYILYLFVVSSYLNSSYATHSTSVFCLVF